MKYLILILSVFLIGCGKMENLVSEQKGFEYFELHIQTKHARARIDINGQVNVIGDTLTHDVKVFIIDDIKYVFIDKLEGDKISISLKTNKYEGKNYGWIESLAIWGKDVELLKK